MSADFEGQRKGEEVILVFRRNFLTAGRGLFFMLFVIALSIVPCFIWQEDSRVFAIPAVGLFVGLLGFGYSWMLWHFSYYLLTNERLRQVRQKGLFNRTVVDLDLERILAVNYAVSGVLGTVCNYGTILIQTGAGDLILSKVSKPDQIHAELQNAIHAASHNVIDEEDDDNEED